MATNQQPSTSAAPAQEYIVRVSKDTKKKESILKFNPSNNMDFTKHGKITMERENNYKEFKQAYDVDMMPKFGAGSEFGREAREEARKKKYGMKTRVYEPDDQPWSLKVGTDNKTNRRFKGIKEGGVLENASYYIFTQCPDGAFEAFPVEEWYNFTPIARYKVLNSEEAEKEFEKREKNVNYFNIMVRKRMKGEEDDTEVDEDGKKVKKGKSKDFMLTEIDEWAILSDSDDSENSENGEAEKKPKKEKKKKPLKKKRKNKNNSDEEALEDSDDLDEGKEVDYMTSSDSEDDAMFKEEGKVSSEKYDEKGVVEEDGLRKLIDSDEEDEEEQNKDDEEDKEEEEGESKGKESKKEGSDSESSSSSDSDSDVEKQEKDGTFASAFFLAKTKNVKKNKSNESTPTSSRSGTPTVGIEDKGKKRKGGETDSPVAKKTRVSTPTPTSTSTSSSGPNDGINDEIVRRYLMRKPMTTKELLIKFKHTGLSKEQRVTTLAQILKRLNPDKKKIKDQLYLSLKKPE